MWIRSSYYSVFSITRQAASLLQEMHVIEVAGWTSGINAGCYSKSGAALSQPALMSAVLTELCAHQFSRMSSGGQGSCMDQVAGMCASSDITACLVQCSSVNHRLSFYIPLHDVSTVVLITIFFGYIPLHGVSVGTIYLYWLEVVFWASWDVQTSCTRSSIAGRCSPVRVVVICWNIHITASFDELCGFCIFSIQGICSSYGIGHFCCCFGHFLIWLRQFQIWLWSFGMLLRQFQMWLWSFLLFLLSFQMWLWVCCWLYLLLLAIFSVFQCFVAFF